MSVSVLELDLPAAHRTVAIGRKAVRHFARLHGVRDAEVHTLRLVVAELLANVVDHAGGGAMEVADAGDERMRLRFEVDGETWRLAVSDSGGGDPEDVRRLIAPDGMPDLEDERGRGFFLLSQSVDCLECDRSDDGRGLTIVATRRHAGD